MTVCSNCGDNTAMYCAYCLTKKSARITELEIEKEIKERCLCTTEKDNKELQSQLQDKAITVREKDRVIEVLADRLEEDYPRSDAEYWVKWATEKAKEDK